MLQPTIQKPHLSLPDDPVPIDSFLKAITLFESLPSELYNWLSAPTDTARNHAESVLVSYWNLSNAESFQINVSEAQFVNISITQQWLRSFLWHIATKFHLADTVFMTSSLPLEAPVSAAKSVMSTIASVSQRSLETHGVGMVSLRSLHLDPIYSTFLAELMMA